MGVRQAQKYRVRWGGWVKYKTILADPPWQYRNKKTGGSMSSGSATKYSTMPTDEICNLKVDDIADRDSVLFLWATVPMIEDAFEVMRSWGYKYKTMIVWRKIMSLGMGFWFRGQVELCLLGIKGDVRAFRCQRPNFIQSKVRRHSEKPEEFFELIESHAPKPRIELFARNRRVGWDAWGNEVKNAQGGGG